MIGGLLEGAAFLAARVQLKLKHEFSDFTTNLIDQLAPSYLAPTPSFVLVQAKPKYGGTSAARRSHAAEQVSFRCDLSRGPTQCRLSLHADRPDHDVAFRNQQGRVFHQRGADAGAHAIAQRRLRGRASTAADCAERGSRRGRTQGQGGGNQAGSCVFSSCRVKSLRFHLTGVGSRRGCLHEQIFAHCTGVYFRILDSFGDPQVVPGSTDMIRQIGFADDEALLPNDNRIFRGFDHLRDYFVFPRSFLGFDLTNLERVVSRSARKPSTSFSLSTT